MVRGNTATIGATGSDGSKGTYTLVRQGGVWKVSGLTRRQ
jgi:hypothetical protein